MGAVGRQAGNRSANLLATVELAQQMLPGALRNPYKKRAMNQEAWKRAQMEARRNAGEALGKGHRMRGRKPGPQRSAAEEEARAKDMLGARASLTSLTRKCECGEVARGSVGGRACLWGLCRRGLGGRECMERRGGIVSGRQWFGRSLFVVET